MGERPILSAYDGPPEPAREAPGYTDQDVQRAEMVPFTPDDVAAAVAALRANRYDGGTYGLDADDLEELARIALDVAAQRWAGRLLPEDTRTEWAWDCGQKIDDDLSCLHFPVGEKPARQWAAERGGRALMRRVAPWVPAPAASDPDAAVRSVVGSAALAGADLDDAFRGRLHNVASGVVPADEVVAEQIGRAGGPVPEEKTNG